MHVKELWIIGKFREIETADEFGKQQEKIGEIGKLYQLSLYLKLLQRQETTECVKCY